MPRDIRFGEDVIKSLIRGVDILANSVGSTLGPGGRNVIFKNYGWPLITKDGVTVARQIELKNEFENIGAQMVKQVANRTCNDAGDGTTTATILAQAILKEGFKHIISGVNPIEIQRGINKAVETVIKYIEGNICQSIAGDEEKVKNIATVSANWDEEIGTIVADAVNAVGLDGSIHVEDSKSYETSLKLVKGVQFDRGYLSPYFINNQSKNIVEMENPKILLYKGNLNSMRNLMPLLEEASKSQTNLILVADGFDPNVISSLVANKNMGRLKIAIIKAPHYKDFRIDTMNDLALMFNTVYFDEAFGDKTLEQLSLAELGTCERVIITDKTASFMGMVATKEQIDERITELKNRKENDELDEITYKNIDLRIAQLCACVATINVGANSEIEFNEKKDRIDDALNATKAAISEGVVPGGSYSYIKATNSKEFKKLLDDKSNPAIQIGARIIQSALLSPFKRLLSNAGREDKFSSYVGKIITSTKQNYGYNVKKDCFENLYESGVIDPFKVTRSALQNAASVSSLMLTTEVVIGDLNEEKQQTTNQIPNLF